MAATAVDPSGLPGRPALVRGVILARVAVGVGRASRATSMDAVARDGGQHWAATAITRPANGANASGGGAGLLKAGGRDSGRISPLTAIDPERYLSLPDSPSKSSRPIVLVRRAVPDGPTQGL